MLAGGVDLGIVELGGTLSAPVVVTDSTGAPKDPTVAPTWRAYGEGDDPMTDGQGSLAKLDTGGITAATNATPIAVTSSNHGLQTGVKVTVSGVLGNTAANGDFTVTRVDANTFTLDGSAGNGPYTSGGAWHVTGLYRLEVECAAGDGYEAGRCYHALVSWTVGVTAYAAICPFRVA